jgi:hypothetical protein
MKRVKLAANEFWMVMGVDGLPPDGDYMTNLEGNRKDADHWRATFNRYAKRYGRDRQAPYRVARVAIVEVKE